MLLLSVLASLFVSDAVVALNGPAVVARSLSVASGRLITAAVIEASIDAVLLFASCVCFLDWFMQLIGCGRQQQSLSAHLTDVVAIWTLLPEWWLRHGASLIPAATAAAAAATASASASASGGAAGSAAQYLGAAIAVSNTQIRWFASVMTVVVPYWRHIRLFRLIKLNSVAARLGCCGGSSATHKSGSVRQSTTETLAPLMV